MTLQESTIEWGALTLHGTRGLGRLTFRTLDGWEGWEGRTGMVARQLGHGAFDAPVLGNARRVQVSGRSGDRLGRDAILAAFGASLTPAPNGSPPGDLRITHAGRVLTAGARLLRYAPTATAWGAGWFEWVAEWVCPDPLRYGDPRSYPTSFPILRGGLEYDLYTDGSVDTGFLEYGEASVTGRVVLENPGTADVWPVFSVDGPIDASGFEIAVVGTDRRIRFSGPVSAGSVLVIDASSGSAVIDGSADRGGLLTFRDWFPVPAGGSVEIAFIPLGVDLGGQLTAVVRPGFW